MPLHRALDFTEPTTYNYAHKMRARSRRRRLPCRHIYSPPCFDYIYFHLFSKPWLYFADAEPMSVGAEHLYASQMFYVNK